MSDRPVAGAGGPGVDPIRVALYRHRFEGVAEEMGVTLRRTAYSPNIKERLDFSCAVFDGDGRMVAQAAHMPVHLGALPASVAAALRAVPRWRPGDLVLLNDPFEGGTHLPDLTMVLPVFLDAAPAPDAAPAYFVANRAHHADVGGISPGSMPLSSEIYQEGIIVPPLKLDDAGRTNEALLALLLRNVRTPDERRGDLAAQRASLRLGARRLLALCAAHGADEVFAYARHLRDYSERLTRAAIATWPDGVYCAEDLLEGAPRVDGSPARIRVAVHVEGEGVRFDFAGTDPQARGPFNAVRSITESACRYVVRCLLDAGGADVPVDVPVNDGCFAPVAVATPPGSLVDAQPPAAVAAGNVETSQRIVDVALRALATALPDRVPAASQGTMNNLTIGGAGADGRPFAYYETIAGGMGAAPSADGADGTHSHMTNTLNTPIEALEGAFPFRVTTYALRRGSGGVGRRRGGDGIVREVLLLRPATVTLLSERRVVAPWGLAGGGAGAVGRNTLVHADGAIEALPAVFSRHLPAGARLRVETPGGGGWGVPEP